MFQAKRQLWGEFRQETPDRQTRQMVFLARFNLTAFPASVTSDQMEVLQELVKDELDKQKRYTCEIKSLNLLFIYQSQGDPNYSSPKITQAVEDREMSLNKSPVLVSRTQNAMVRGNLKRFFRVTERFHYLTEFGIRQEEIFDTGQEALAVAISS